MAFFPASDPHSCAIIAEEIAAMCGEDDQAIWLARQFTTAHKKWPGIGELRAFFCSCYAPLDGVDAYSELYPDGIPRGLLGNPPGRPTLTGTTTPLALPAPRATDTSTDPALQKLVTELADSARFPEPAPRRTIQEIEAELYKKREVVAKV